MSASYRAIGRRIVEFEQGGEERAEYGEALIKKSAKDLSHHWVRLRSVHLSQFFFKLTAQETFQTPSVKPHSPSISPPVHFPDRVRQATLVKSSYARTFYDCGLFVWLVDSTPSRIKRVNFLGRCHPCRTTTPARRVSMRGTLRCSQRCRATMPSPLRSLESCFKLRNPSFPTSQTGGFWWRSDCASGQHRFGAESFPLGSMAA